MEHLEILIEEKFDDLNAKIKGIEELLKKLINVKEDDSRFASKQAREFALKNDIDINLVQGTGNNGKITLIDLKKVLKRQHPCKGVNSNGDPCHRFGTEQASDEEWYCASHLKKNF